MFFNKVFVYILANLLVPALCQRTCTVSLEKSHDSQVKFEDLTLDVISPQTGKVAETFSCTPDGNCFAVIQNLESFILRVSGLPNARFEPHEYIIDSQKQSCEDLTFRLKGFGLSIPIKHQNSNDQLTVGPKDIKIILTNQSGNSIEATTGVDGVAVFDEVSLGDQVTASVLVPKVNGIDSFHLQSSSLECKKDKVGGYTCSGGNVFVIDGMLVHGTIKRAESGASHITVRINDEQGDVIKEVQTDSEGNYYFDGIREGQYDIIPEDNLSASDFKLQFRPPSIQKTVQIGFVI